MFKNSRHFALIFSARKLLTFAMLIYFLAYGDGVANASKRVALVIGNSAYENAIPLKNPRNDAEDLAVKLKSLGFEVVSGFDLDSRGMRDKVREFGQQLRGAEVAMFFYAGHALQVNGRNYLAPVNTDIRNESDLDFETIPMDFVQRQMERETKTILLFLDACRDNPLARSLRASSRSTGSVRGLARETNSSEGTFIAFATQPNNVALDGNGRNSPFTTALLENIDRPGVEISTLMTDVRRQVFELTKEQQIPWINSSLLGRFYFNPEEKIEVAKVEVTPVVAPKSTIISEQQTEILENEGETKIDRLMLMRVEQLAWQAVKDSKDLDELRAFINAYGDGFFGDLAKLRLKKSEKSDRQKLAKLNVESTERKIEVEKSLADKPEIQIADDTGLQQKITTNQPSKVALLAPPKVEDGRNDNVVNNYPVNNETIVVVTRDITRQIQNELNRIGCAVGTADGLWGRKSTRATGLYSKHAKVKLATLEPTHELLQQLQGVTDKICPAPVIAIRKRAKTCRSGQKLSRKGNCYWPRKAKNTSRNTKTQRVQSGRQPTQFQQPRRKSGLLGGAVN
jgi:hypothetical protein